MNLYPTEPQPDGIAIIGIAGRFPGACNPDELWRNLKQGVESISHIAVEDLEVRNAAEKTGDPNYVRARGILRNADLFDAAFFDIYPKEAELIDPQHRVFLECCWEALEDAGRDPSRVPELTGVFAGCSQNSYFLTSVCDGPAFLREYAEAYQSGYFPTLMGTIGDTLATRVAYKLNLQGPSMTVSCACSTSLVAVSQACGSLINYQCDVALAGGVSISFPQNRGYLHQPGAMVSPDGHCRSFDVDAAGTVFGAGAGVVVLKRLGEALRDRDHIYAVIRGSAVNNDGGRKAGFTAPGADGQARVIAMAQAVAGVDPRTIGYIEAHGTATPLGDPIEVEALTQVFRESTPDIGFCALGTVKTNIGHLDIASGVTGLIKAALTLKHRQLTPTLHFRSPNPKLRLESSPFYVNTDLREWESPAGQPRRAGVSAFGLGGTNCHAVLEEAPEKAASSQSRPHQLLTVSAKSPEALKDAKRRLAEHLGSHSTLNLADAAFTLQTGRAVFPFRSALVCRNAQEAVASLGREATAVDGESEGDVRVSSSHPPPVCFLFPGQGSQYAGMGHELYLTEPRFRDAVDECAEILKPLSGVDLRTAIFRDSLGSRRHQLDFTRLAQPAIFTIEYALARLWMHWGIRPSGMVGHSVGEFACACISGVFSLKDALSVVAERAAMMASVPEGAMLAVRLSEAELRPLLSEDLSIAAVNAPSLSVAAGPMADIAALQKRLEKEDIAAVRLRTSHAFHSAMMNPILPRLAETVRRVTLNPPQLPWVSCVTGDWITDAIATDPDYWANHCRGTVRFADAVQKLGGISGAIFLETGPGTTLRTLIRQSLPSGSNHLRVSSLVERKDESQESRHLMEALGQFWAAGVELDWKNFYEAETRHRVPLPTYPFERKRYWIDRPNIETTTSAPEPPTRAEAAAEKAEMETKTSPMPSVPNRKEEFAHVLVGMLQDLSGLDSGLLDPRASFLELGFDSLFLTQLSQSIQSKFGIKVTFRQLLDRISSVNEVATYLDEHVPQSPAPAPAVASATAVVDPMATGGSDIERLIADQLQTLTKLFADQLAAARGVKPSPSSGAVAPAQNPQPATADGAPGQGAAAALYRPWKPMEHGSRGELDSTQQAYLNALIDRYTKRTGESKRLTEKYRRVLADPRVASGFRQQWKEIVYPITTRRSSGSRLWDVDGNEYIDLVNGFGPILFGHRPDFVAHAVAAQLGEGIEIGPQTPLAGEVAELLCELTGMERATFCNTGSEAVMAAVRLARTVTGRNKIVLFAGDYHGNYEEVLVKRTGRDGSLRTGPVAPGITPEAVANVIVLDYGTPEALRVIREHASELAAVLVEPVQSRHPNLQPRDFLLEVRNITAASGTALIFDEIVTGFRVHQGGAQALYGIRADMATYGKILGGGLPIGAVAGKAAFMDALDGGMWNYGDDSYPETGVTFFAGTFVRHPLAMAAARAVLRQIKECGPELQHELTVRTGQLTDRLNEIFSQYAIPAKIETCGNWFYWSFPNDFPFGSLFYFHLREKGIHILEGFPCFLTSAHSDSDLQHVVEAFSESMAEMSAGGVLPERDVTPAVARKQSPVAPITESQLEILVSAKLSDDANCSYNEAFTIELTGKPDQPALEGALRAVVDRHDALRATFDLESKTIRFVSAPALAFPFSDYSASLDPAAELTRLIEDDATIPFDLDHGPLVRIRIVRLGPEQHVVMFTSHHIVCDGWSTNILIEEIGALYTARTQGEPAKLEESLSFSVYATDLDGQRESADNQAVERYWLDQFHDLPPLLDLPVDRPRPGVKSYEGGTVRRTLDLESTQALKRLGISQQCTLFVTLLSGFEALLSRLTGQDDLVVGIPAAAQSLLEGQTLVGHCVNFLPLRARVQPDAPFAELLRQSRQTLLDAYDHQQYTFGTLVRKLGTPRDPARLPLIEVQFNLERLGAQLHFGNLGVSVDSCPKKFVNFDLFLNIVESNSGLLLDCDYNTQLFDEATIASWMEAYECLLRSASRNADVPVGRLPLLNDSQRRELIVRRNETALAYPRNHCVHRLFEEQASRNAGQIAVAVGDESVTYAELNKRAGQLANFLREQGAGRGSLVAILVERSVEMVVAMLGVLKAGAAYLPLDPAYPEERLGFILDEAKPTVILTQRKVARDLRIVGNRDGAKVLNLDSEWSTVAQHSPVFSGQEPCSADLAYVIYTSGSTGKPKGVRIPHRAVVNFLCSMLREPGLSASDRLLAVTTLAFDIAALEIFLPLAAGAVVVIATREQTTDGHLLAKAIADAGISVMQATPSTWQLLLDAGWQPSPSLCMLCGGEALPRELADKLLAGDSRETELWNMYGPTETTIWSAVSRVKAGPGPVPIGPPVANTQFYILDGNLEPQPLGVPGELYIGGDGVADGYFERPELTAERFVGDPFRTDPDCAARLYRTGDLVRALRNGELEFLGRLDNQVKLRGFRIELGEIESALLKSSDVREAVVAVREERGSKNLVAYFVPGKSGFEVSASDMKASISRYLPAYMVPTFYISLPEIPRTPNGKVNRHALPGPDWQMAAATRTLRAPRNSEEERLVSICSEVLMLEQMGIDENLFELGADSIQIFRIVARANQAGLSLTAAQVLRNPTIAGISSALSNAEPVTRISRKGAIVPVLREAHILRAG